MTRISPPALLQVNQESRREGLTIYQELHLGPAPIEGCYVDFTRDIIYLKSNLLDVNNQEYALDGSESNIIHRGRLASPPPRQNAATISPLTRLSPTVREPQEGDSYGLRHSKIILYDLLTSTGGEAMLQALHVDPSTWKIVRGHYRYRRHNLSLHLKHLVLVYESGKGPLSGDMQLSFMTWDRVRVEDEYSETHRHRENRIATIMKQSFRAENMWINGQDRKKGLPAVLNFTVESMRLDRSRRDEGKASRLAEGQVERVELLKK